ncbi:MAG: hypothetical protein K8J09_19555, partial [Planctomycetes bacterium]|nr:hypothetical protein [Planctomycetota bacterium]
GLPSGTFTMHAGGDARGLASMTTTVTGGPRTATLVLQRGATLQGRVEAARGDLTALVVEWRADDDSWSDAVRVAADGSFTFANLPHQRGTLLLWGPAGGLPLAQEREVLCDNGEVRLRLPTAATMRTWSITPVVTTNDLPPRLLLHEPATGFTLALGAPEAGGLWSTRLRPGAYELLAPNGAGHGSLFWVSGDADVDAGKLELPPPGELHFEVPEPLRSHADASVELFALRDDFDRLVARGGDELLLPQFVPAGEYGLVCRDATGALRFGRVHVAAGERATLRLDDPTACR